MALFTAGTDMSSVAATSAAEQPSTSIRSSAARCLGGRCWSAAMKASRMLWRRMARSAVGVLRQDL
jgi:hypothetical protein